jgi:hypothetical protein
MYSRMTQGYVGSVMLLCQMVGGGVLKNVPRVQRGVDGNELHKLSFKTIRKKATKKST